MNDQSQQQDALQKEIAAFRKLEAIGMTEEFKEFTDTLLETVTSKMLVAFTKDAVKNWDEFCAVRGEIQARLQQIEVVRGAGASAAYLENKLQQNYGMPKDFPLDN